MPLTSATTAFLANPRAIDRARSPAVDPVASSRLDPSGRVTAIWPGDEGDMGAEGSERPPHPRRRLGQMMPWLVRYSSATAAGSSPSMETRRFSSVMVSLSRPSRMAPTMVSNASGAVSYTDVGMVSDTL